jgi:hypothetical protein
MPQFVRQADSAMVYPVYDTAYGYNNTATVIREDLRNLRQRGVHTLYLPMGLPPKYLPLLAQFNIRVLTQPKAEEWAIYHPYPLETRAQFLPLWYRRDEPAPEWGLFTALEPKLGFTFPRIFLIVGSMLVLFMVAVWRQMSPGSFTALFTGFYLFSASRPARTTEKSLLDGFIVFYLLILQVLIATISLSLVVQVIGSKNQLELLNLFQDPSFLYRLEQVAAANPWQLSAYLFAFFGGLLLLKIIFLAIIGNVYQIRGLVQRITEYMSSGVFLEASLY